MIAHEQPLVVESISQPITRWGAEVCGAAAVDGAGRGAAAALLISTT
jgi:hypothetical protein